MNSIDKSINKSSKKLEPSKRGDTIQVDKKMTKDSRDHSHYKQSSQQSSQDSIKDLTDLTRGRTWHRPEHQMFFLLVFLKIKHVVNNLGSL